jgi:hypothetical protein
MTIAVLAPGNGKARTGRLWTYVVNERPWQGERAPADYYRDRRDERPRDHLARFRGVTQAEAFSGYQALTRPVSAEGGVGRRPPLIHAACWALPWTALRAQDRFGSFGDHGRVQPSIRPCVAALAAASFLVD